MNMPRVTESRVVFPELRRFSDLFDVVAKTENDRPGPRFFTTTDYHPKTRKPFSCQISVGPYCSVRAEGTTYALWVRANDKIFKYISGNFIGGARDSIFFEVIFWDDGRALVTSSNNQILASRWLAVVDAKSVPLESVD